jgi:hypothetical protein
MPSDIHKEIRWGKSVAWFGSGISILSLSAAGWHFYAAQLFLGWIDLITGSVCALSTGFLIFNLCGLIDLARARGELDERKKG